MKWTPQQAEAHQARVAFGRGHSRTLDASEVTPIKQEPRESALHKQINLECHRRGYIALHGAMHKATARTAGEPDFVVLMPCGKVALIECKTPNGKLSDDQERLHGKAWTLGHKVHVVRSFVEFLETIKMKEAR